MGILIGLAGAVVLLAVAYTLFLYKARQLVNSFDEKVERFEIASPELRRRIAGIPRAFLQGYNSMLSWRSPRACKQALEQMDPYYKAFALEGAAMGYAARILVNPWSAAYYERAITRLAPEDLYQNYVGMGWWLDMAFGGRPDRLAAITRRLDPRYRLLPYEGLGFRTGFFDPERQHPPLFERFSGDVRSVCFQGYGRSLWFTRSGRPADIARIVSTLPPQYRADVYSGLGLAVAFTTIYNPELAFGVVPQVPPPYRTAFAQGLAFGWEARRRHDLAYFQEQTGGLPPGARQAVHSVIAAVHQATASLAASESDPGYYARWVEQTRETIDQFGIVNDLARSEADLAAAQSASGVQRGENVEQAAWVHLEAAWLSAARFVKWMLRGRCEP